MAERAQVIGAILVGIAIVAVAIIAVTAQLGPTSVTELDAAEERRDQQIEAIEERREAREERGSMADGS